MCCGKKRQQLRSTEYSSRGAPTPKTDFGRQPIRYSHAYFQFLGKGAIMVQGPVTGRRYRFEAYGAVTAVDLRDRRSLATVSSLRQVRGPAIFGHRVQSEAGAGTGLTTPLMKLRFMVLKA
jgi:hypothetical protein